MKRTRYIINQYREKFNENDEMHRAKLMSRTDYQLKNEDGDTIYESFSKDEAYKKWESYAINKVWCGYVESYELMAVEEIYDESGSWEESDCDVIEFSDWGEDKEASIGWEEGKSEVTINGCPIYTASYFDDEYDLRAFVSDVSWEYKLTSNEEEKLIEVLKKHIECGEDEE